MSMNFKTLSELPEDELLRLYDEAAEHTCVGINYYMEEIARRREETARQRNEKSNNLMIQYTKWITIMTIVMLICTIANVLIAIFK